MAAKQVPPLRYASVGMTNLFGAEAKRQKSRAFESPFSALEADVAWDLVENVLTKLTKSPN